MSTIKVNSIKNTSTNDGGIAIDNSGHVQVDGQQLPTAGALGHRNLLINGAMNVAQRATSKTGITLSEHPTVDRMVLGVSNCGTWTSTQESDGPTGFSNSFKMLCTTADASPAANDFAVFQYFFEAQDLQHLNYGTSDAVPVTVSFWVKSNKTGNASFAALQFDASNRTFSKQYTINAANTWEYKTITIPADASGQIDDDNDKGLLIEWWCNSGTDFSSGSHPTTWTAQDDTDRNATNIGIGQAVNDYFQITGIQLEVGEKATSFEHRSYGDELARCQRYYIKYVQQGCSGFIETASADEAALTHHLPVPMRATPSATCTTASGIGVERGSLYGIDSTTGSVSWIYGNNVQVNWSLDTALTRWHTTWCRVQNVQFSAEL